MICSGADDIQRCEACVIMLRNLLKNVFCPNPPEVDKSLCWILVFVFDVVFPCFSDLRIKVKKIFANLDFNLIKRAGKVHTLGTKEDV